MFSGCTSPYDSISKEYHKKLNKALKKSGENRKQLIKAIKNISPEQRDAMAFLISYMPEHDLISITSAILIDNVTYAFKAKEKFSWCQTLHDSIFFYEVLPYCNITEDRDNWRKDFYERFSYYVKDCKTIDEAIENVNKNIKEELGVEYNTNRRASDQGDRKSVV